MTQSQDIIDRTDVNFTPINGEILHVGNYANDYTRWFKHGFLEPQENCVEVHYYQHLITRNAPPISAAESPSNLQSDLFIIYSCSYDDFDMYPCSNEDYLVIIFHNALHIYPLSCAELQDKTSSERRKIAENARKNVIRVKPEDPNDMMVHIGVNPIIADNKIYVLTSHNSLQTFNMRGELLTYVKLTQNGYRMMLMTSPPSSANPEEEFGIIYNFQTEKGQVVFRIARLDNVSHGIAVEDQYYEEQSYRISDLRRLNPSESSFSETVIPYPHSEWTTIYAGGRTYDTQLCYPGRLIKPYRIGYDPPYSKTQYTESLDACKNELTETDIQYLTNHFDKYNDTPAESRELFMKKQCPPIYLPTFGGYDFAAREAYARLLPTILCNMLIIYADNCEMHTLVFSPDKYRIKRYFL